MRKQICPAVLLSLALCLTACGAAADSFSSKTVSRTKLDKQEVPMYFISPDDERTITLFFTDEDHEIPYISADTVKELLETICHERNLDDGFGLTLETNGDTAVLTRESDYTMELDCGRDEIRFWDYDAFFVSSTSPTAFDILHNDGEIPCLEKVEESSYSRYGSEVTFDLKPYGIDLIEKDGACYMPLQTVSDLFTSLPGYVNFFYNGDAVFVNEFGSEGEKELAELYFESKAGDPKRSKVLAEFTYNELCMVMDYLYGLKSQHGIERFDDFFDETGLKPRLLSEDAVESSKAVAELMYLYLADGHSSVAGNSWRIGEDADLDGDVGKSIVDLYVFTEEFADARSKFYPEGVPGYEEIGNTAYITFDSFGAISSGADYYGNPPVADTEDTVELCLYAFRQITRQGSPIENVVLDISNNGGGEVISGSFVMSMFLGDASICVEDTLTGAYVNETFHCDANLDGIFDEKDSLRGYRLFCLTSPSSFSCGNLTPSVLQDSKRVKIVGITSGGGACVLMPLSMADGTSISISGFFRLGYMKNGAVYDIDRGVEPDYPITTPDRFYDREALTKYINSLY